MASPCPSCKYKPFGIMEKIEDKRYLKTMKRIRGLYFDVDLGAGRKDKFTFDEANKMYMSRYFPDSDQKVYCCPPVYEYKHPGEPSDIIEHAKDDQKVPFLKFSYDTLKEERRGEIPEEKTIQMFLRMFQQHNIPSFVIHKYNWKTIYMKQLSNLYPQAYKSFQKLNLKEGEVDALISIPRKCLIIVQVKATDPRSKAHVGDVVDKAFFQCVNTATFLSKICSDLDGDKNIPLIGVAALPNCEMRIIEDFNYCQACIPHIITSENIETVDALFDWFKNITGRFHKDGQPQFDENLQKCLIGRLIGSASLLKLWTNSKSILRTAHQIEDKHGTAEKIQTRHLQLNPEQLAVKFSESRFLLIKGKPASGKTVLAYMKINEILKESGSTTPRYDSGKRQRPPTTSALINITMSQEAQLSTSSLAADNTQTPAIPTLRSYILHPAPETTVEEPLEKLGIDSVSGDGNIPTSYDDMKSNFQSVIYVFTGDRSMGLSQVFQDKFEQPKTPNCQIIITSFEEFGKGTEPWNLGKLPKLIKLLQRKNEGKIVHIIFDECRYRLNQLGHDQFKKEWNTVFDKTRLGYVWCIQQPNNNEQEKDLGYVLPFEFTMVYLRCTMRLSRQNIEFANKFLEDKNLNLKSGHAVTGLRPVMYRLKCVCNSLVLLDPFQCNLCYHIRLVLLLQHVLDDFKICRDELVSESKLGLRDVAFLCVDRLSVFKIGGYLGDVSPPISFAVNKCSLSSTNGITLCTVDFFRGCERRFVIVDFHAMKMSYDVSKEALTRSLGQLVMLDCGFSFEEFQEYEHAIEKVITARDLGKIEVKEIERTSEDVEKMNLTHSKNKSHEQYLYGFPPKPRRPSDRNINDAVSDTSTHD